TGGQPGDRVRVKVRIDRSTGKVVSAKAQMLRGNATVAPCVENAALQTKFGSRGEGIQVATRRLTL
ncbi:MAG: hypothetical protein KDK70_33070, partial [Myxococcales bacterium]|nr:hypothetical protein [Myxococcales bacterium]